MKNIEILLRETLKALRGSRSYEQVRRKLGAQSLNYSHWEAGRSAPSWEQFVEACLKLSSHGKVAFSKNFGQIGKHPEKIPVRLLERTNLSSSAKTMNLSRSSLSRYSKGEVRISCLVAWKIIHFRTYQLLNFLDDLVGLENLESGGAELKKDLHIKNMFWEKPLIAVVLRLLETKAYHALPSHQVGYISEKLNISLSAEAEIVQYLVDHRLIEFNPQQRYRVTALAKRVDVSNLDPEQLKDVKEFWLQQAAKYFSQDSGEKTQAFGYEILSVHTENIEQIRQELRSCHMRIRSLLTTSPGDAEKVIMVYMGLNEIF